MRSVEPFCKQIIEENEMDLAAMVLHASNTNGSPIPSLNLNLVQHNLLHTPITSGLSSRSLQNKNKMYKEFITSLSEGLSSMTSEQCSNKRTAAGGIMLTRRGGGSKRRPSSSVLGEDVSPGGKRRRKQRTTVGPVQNVREVEEERYRRRETKRSAAETTTAPIAASQREATTVTANSEPSANGLSVRIVAISEAAIVARDVRRRYPPPFPHVPPHAYDASWRKVRMAPRVSASRTGPKSASVEWVGGRIRCGLGYRTDDGVSADIGFYELYVCQETGAPPDVGMWHLTGRRVPPLPFPIVCDLVELPAGHRYYFAVRPVDVHERRGPFGLAEVQL